MCRLITAFANTLRSFKWKQSPYEEALFPLESEVGPKNRLWIQGRQIPAEAAPMRTFHTKLGGIGP